MCGFRAGTNLEEEDGNCYSDRAREDINNLGLAAVELSMQDKVGDQEKQKGNGVSMDFGGKSEHTKSLNIETRRESKIK